MPRALTPHERKAKADRLGLLYDEQDADTVMQYTWYVGADGYVRTNGATGSLLMHRIIMGDPPENGQVIDHINGVRTDNRRSNLRWTSSKENRRRASHADMSHITTRDWQHQQTYQVRIKDSGRYVLNKTYTTLVEAVAARDAAFAVMRAFDLVLEPEE